MRTAFSAMQLSDPHLADAEANLRACMHCGICTATCPTYVLLGDERDGPRGRIVMMQAMLEQGGAPSAETVLHVDRCLSCLACTTACPSGVNYSRLVDLSRSHIETHFSRPLHERLLRWAIAGTMSRPARIRVGLALARLFAPIATRLPGRIGAMARKAENLQTRSRPVVPPRVVRGAQSVALLPGCVQAAVAPEIDQALSRVLARRGFAPTVLEGAGCCGALAHHLGRSAEAKVWAKRAIEAFERAARKTDPAAVTISATGCAAHLADYAHLFQDDPGWKARAEAFAAKVVDPSRLVEPRKGWPPRRLRVAFHSACSAQNGLKLKGEAELLLREAGFEVLGVPEGHLCCGSAGSYSLLQPKIAGELRARKLANIESVAPDIVATGNIGCLVHLMGPDAPPAVHYAELLDWVEGGVKPQALLRREVDARAGAR
jgi:glycolate oxidase iron-sulfur subunit